MGFCGWLFFFFPCHSRYWQFTPFYGHIILQRMNRPHLINSSVNGQSFPQLDCYILLLWPFMWTFLPGECFLSVIYLGVEQRSWQLMSPFSAHYLHTWEAWLLTVKIKLHVCGECEAFLCKHIIFTCQLLSGDLCGWLLTQDWTGIFN